MAKLYDKTNRGQCRNVRAVTSIADIDHVAYNVAVVELHRYNANSPLAEMWFKPTSGDGPARHIPLWKSRIHPDWASLVGFFTINGKQFMVRLFDNNPQGLRPRVVLKFSEYVEAEPEARPEPPTYEEMMQEAMAAPDQPPVPGYDAVDGPMPGF